MVRVKGPFRTVNVYFRPRTPETFYVLRSRDLSEKPGYVRLEVKGLSMELHDLTRLTGRGFSFPP